MAAACGILRLITRIACVKLRRSGSIPRGQAACAINWRMAKCASSKPHSSCCTSSGVLLRSTVLRSKTPDLVLQELWGLLLAHFAIRQLMVQAAWPRGLDPDRLSFTHAVRVIKRKMPQAAAVPP